MSFLFGALGMLAVLGLFFGGMLAGWKLHERQYRAKPGAPTDAEKETLRQQIAQQKAWRDMQNYSVEAAYGLTKNPLGEEIE